MKIKSFCAVVAAGMTAALPAAVEFSVSANQAKAFAVNPITPEGEFLSDPAPRVGPDGVLRLFGSRDEDLKSYCSVYNDVFETRDLLRWRIRRGAFVSAGEADALPATDRQLYAPDALPIGGRWALFYCTPDGTHRAGLALSDRPEGPYVFSREYPWARQIDPSVFRDDDGRIYYTWGQFSMKMAELKGDLSGFVPGTMRDGDGSRGGPSIFSTRPETSTR